MEWDKRFVTSDVGENTHILGSGESASDTVGRANITPGLQRIASTHTDAEEVICHYRALCAPRFVDRVCLGVRSTLLKRAVPVLLAC